LHREALSTLPGKLLQSYITNWWWNDITVTWKSQ